MDNNKQLALRKRWVEALRSGKYEQTGGALRITKAGTVVAEPDRFCCLGVLCDIVAPGEWKEPHTSGQVVGMVPFHDITTGGDLVGTLSEGMRMAAGLTNHQVSRLAGMNDREGKSFQEIADWIETAPVYQNG